jgi:predicted outer membrane repeat protein
MRLKIGTLIVLCCALWGIIPAAVAQDKPLPPADFFQFPFPIGQAWVFSGTHKDSANSQDEEFSAIDFHPRGRPGQLDWGGVTQYSVVAMASGIATKTSACGVEIVHDNGWKTSYYHMEAVPDFNQTPVEANEFIGMVADTIAEAICEGGNPGDPHVHIGLKYNNQPVDLDGVTIGGWTIHGGTSNYDDSPENMWIYRGDERKFAKFERVTNDPTLTHEFQIEPGNTEQLVDALHQAMGNGLSDTIILSPASVYTFSEPHRPLGGEEDSTFPIIDNDSGQSITIIGNGATIERSADSPSSFRFFRVDEGAHLILEDVILRNGAAEFGGAIIIFEGGRLTLNGTEFIGNQSEESGGAIYVQESTLNVADSYFADNLSSFGGAIASRSTDSLQIESTVFTNNLASERGSAVFVSQGNGMLANSCIVNNRGASVVDVHQGQLQAQENWWGDSSGPSGDFDGQGDKALGAMDISAFLQEAPEFCGTLVQVAATATQVQIADGDTAALIQAIEQIRSTGEPVEIVLAENGSYIFDRAYEDDNALPRVVDVAVGTDVTIIGNGSELVRDASGARFRFLSVVFGAELRLIDVTLRGGATDFGGAIQNYEANLILDGVTITENTASQSGGGIYSQNATLSIQNSVISDNHAVFGGGIASNRADTTLQNVWLHQNEAAENGGGLMLSDQSQLTLNRGHFENNLARFGAGIFLETETAAISESHLSGNSASASGDAIFISDSQETRIEESCFEAHSGTVIDNRAFVQVSASGNWWGTSDGIAAGQLEGSVLTSSPLDTKPDYCDGEGLITSASSE